MAEATAPGMVELEIREVQGVPVIDISGEVTPATEDALSAAFEEACSSSSSAVILNFGGLEYMNSGGIGLLVTLLVRAQRQRIQLLAYGLTDHYRQIFELTRLDDAIGVHSGEQAALAAVR